MHSTSAGVQILEYHLLGPEKTDQELENNYSYSLIGAAYFSERAESHKGLCHGGSMCALMDDIVGKFFHQFDKNHKIYRPSL